MPLTNGMIVRGTGPKVYLVENGKKRWIPDPPTLMTLGGWGVVQNVSDVDLFSVPDGDPYPSVLSDPIVTASSHANLGANHFMDTNATLHRNGHIDATTRTRTGTWFGGFVGGVNLAFFDGTSGAAIGQSNVHRFGVDGTVIGRSDRTDYWGEDADASIGAQTAQIEVLQYWAPRYDALANIVQHAVDVGMKAAPLLKELKDLGLIP